MVNRGERASPCLSTEGAVGEKYLFSSATTCFLKCNMMQQRSGKRSYQILIG